MQTPGKITLPRRKLDIIKGPPDETACEHWIALEAELHIVASIDRTSTHHGAVTYAASRQVEVERPDYGRYRIRALNQLSAQSQVDAMAVG